LVELISEWSIHYREDQRQYYVHIFISSHTDVVTQITSSILLFRLYNLHEMPLSFPKFTFKNKGRPLDTESVNSDSPGSSIVGGNGWLACKEALKILNDMAPGPLAPLQMALVGVLACMDHAEVLEFSEYLSLISDLMAIQKVSGSQDEFVQLASHIVGFKDIFLPYQDRADLSPIMHDHLGHILK